MREKRTSLARASAVCSDGDCHHDQQMQKRRQGAKPGAGREEVDAVGADMKNSQPVIWIWV